MRGSPPLLPTPGLSRTPSLLLTGLQAPQPNTCHVALSALTHHSHWEELVRTGRGDTMCFHCNYSNNYNICASTRSARFESLKIGTFFSKKTSYVMWLIVCTFTKDIKIIYPMKLSVIGTCGSNDVVVAGFTMLLVSGMGWRSHLLFQSTAACSPSTTATRGHDRRSSLLTKSMCLKTFVTFVPLGLMMFVLSFSPCVVNAQPSGNGNKMQMSTWLQKSSTRLDDMCQRKEKVRLHSCARGRLVCNSNLTWRLNNICDLYIYWLWYWKCSS